MPGIEGGGILHARGPNLMAGYPADRPACCSRRFPAMGEGWYETGDVVAIDDEGFVRIVGRVKRFAKIAGEMVSLEVVEKLAVASSPAQAATPPPVSPTRPRAKPSCCSTTDGGLSRDLLVAKARELGLLNWPCRGRSTRSMPCRCSVPARSTTSPSRSWPRWSECRIVPFRLPLPAPLADPLAPGQPAGGRRSPRRRRLDGCRPVLVNPAAPRC